MSHALTLPGGRNLSAAGHREGVILAPRLEAGDGLHDALLALARGRREALPEVYDGTVEPALRLALARTRGDLVSAERLLARCYVEVRRRAGEYPSSGLRPLPWVLALVARA